MLNTNAALYKASVDSTALTSYKNALLAIPLFGDQLPPSAEGVPVTASYDGLPVFIPAYGQNNTGFTLEVVDAPSNGLVRIDKGVAVFSPAFGFVGAVTFSVKCVDNDTFRLASAPVGFIISVSEFLIDAARWAVLWLGVLRLKRWVGEFFTLALPSDAASNSDAPPQHTHTNTPNLHHRRQQGSP